MEIVDGVVHDQTLDKQVRVRDSYLLVRQRLVEELRTNYGARVRQQ